MTRGRHTNTAHLVADNLDAARAQWIATFSRDRADLGPAHAATTAAGDIDRYGPTPRRPLSTLHEHALRPAWNPSHPARPLLPAAPAARLTRHRLLTRTRRAAEILQAAGTPAREDRGITLWSRRVLRCPNPGTPGCLSE